MMAVSLKHCQFEQNQGISQLLKDSENKKVRSVRSLSQTAILNLPSTAASLVKKTCHQFAATTLLEHSSSCSCEQLSTFRLSFRNGCIRNSLGAPYCPLVFSLCFPCSFEAFSHCFVKTV